MPLPYQSCSIIFVLSGVLVELGSLVQHCFSFLLYLALLYFVTRFHHSFWWSKLFRGQNIVDTQAVTHPSTTHAYCCLTSVIDRKQALFVTQTEIYILYVKQRKEHLKSTQMGDTRAWATCSFTHLLSSLATRNNAPMWWRAKQTERAERRTH
jgi:hypothetical protein